MNPQHIREDRPSTADEVEKDSLTLARIRDMFPSSAEIQQMSPQGICEAIPQWLPFIEEAKAACVTDQGTDTFRRLAEFLSEIMDLGPADTTIQAAERAFYRLTEISLALRDEAREIATNAREDLPMINNNQRDAETTALLDRLAAIESLVQVKIVEPDEASTRAMVEKVTSAIEAALNGPKGNDAAQENPAALSRKISSESQGTDTPVSPRDAYATLMTLARMGYTVTAPKTKN